MARESTFKTRFLNRVEEEFPGCIIIRLDPEFLQGIPDTLVLIGTTWFALEFKRSKTAPKRPNQDYYVEKLYHMSYAAFVYPENEEEIFDELQRTFKFGGTPRFPQPQ